MHVFFIISCFSRAVFISFFLFLFFFLSNAFAAANAFSLLPSKWIVFVALCGCAWCHGFSLIQFLQVCVSHKYAAARCYLYTRARIIIFWKCITSLLFVCINFDSYQFFSRTVDCDSASGFCLPVPLERRQKKHDSNCSLSFHFQ